MEQIVNLTQHKATPGLVLAGVVDLDEPDATKLKKLLTFDELPTTRGIRYVTKSIALLGTLAYPDATAAMIDEPSFLVGSLEWDLLEYDILPLYAFSEDNSTGESIFVEGCTYGK